MSIRKIISYFALPFLGINSEAMSKVCELTGKKAMTGHHVSFSNKKNKRRFEVNLSKKRFYIPEEDRWITLRVSASALKDINRKGISAVLKDARAKGLID